MKLLGGRRVSERARTVSEVGHVHEPREDAQDEGRRLRAQLLLARRRPVGVVSGNNCSSAILGRHLGPGGCNGGGSCSGLGCRTFHPHSSAVQRAQEGVDCTLLPQDLDALGGV